MAISREQLVEGVAGYIEDEMLSALDGGAYWVGATAIVLLMANPDAILGSLLEHKLIKFMGIVDKNGDIDIEKAYNAFKKASKSGKFKPVTISLQRFGLPDEFDLTPTDIDKLYDRLKKLERPATADAETDDDQ